MRMSPENFRLSLQFIWDSWMDNGLFPEYLTIEYVGGEILLIPPKELTDIVTFARTFFTEKGVRMKDGVQSNLIGSKRRLDHLYELFEGRVGTSIDNVTDQRTVNGSRESYRVFFRESDSHFRSEHGVSIPAVFTLDKASIGGLEKELKLSRQQSRNLTIRPVFEGGIENINAITSEDLGEAMVKSFRLWFMRSNVILEPHAQLLSKWVSLKSEVDSPDQNDLCPFQNNCAQRSVSLEPNGDLYVCQELGDAGELRLGNAVFEDWNEENWSTVNSRKDNLHEDCVTCPYLAVCQGGCMMQAIQDGNGPFGKPNYCSAWKAIFGEMDESIKRVGIERVKSWMKTIY